MNRRRPPRGRVRRGTPGFRLRVGFVVVAMVLSVFAARLVQLQLFDPGSYAQAAAAENLAHVTLPASRGEIVDRNGKPLADSLDGLMVTADPALVTPAQAPKLATLLSHRLGVDYFSTLAKLQKTDTQFQYIARRVPAETATAAVDAAEAQGYHGLDTARDPIREYPAQDVAANILGFMGTDGPLGGLELNFDKELSGKSGRETYEVGTDGTHIPLGKSSMVAPVNGRTLKLTIDEDVQWYMQRVLGQAVRQWGAVNGYAVAMQTGTGEILGLADYPTFNADDPSASPAKDLGAASLSAPYEPGSVEKVLTLSSLINLGKVTPETREVIPPVLKVPGGYIHDWWNHGTLHYTLAGVIAMSSNIGTVEASSRFGKGQLRKYLVKFGLGKATGIGVPGESGGILPTTKEWTQALQDRIDFGQSVAVNAVQEAAAVNTIANGGVRVDPSLIMGKATTDSGQVVGTDETTRRRVVSKKTAHEVMEMMERVPDPATGTAPGARVPGYRVAGKTGTAQRVNPATGTYQGGGYTVSFVGFAPADKPAFTVYVVLNDPKDAAASGGGSAGPVFGRIMSFLLHHYGVPTTGTKPSHLATTW